MEKIINDLILSYDSELAEIKVVFQVPTYLLKDTLSQKFIYGKIQEHGKKVTRETKGLVKLHSILTEMI